MKNREAELDRMVCLNLILGYSQKPTMEFRIIQVGLLEF